MYTRESRDGKNEQSRIISENTHHSWQKAQLRERKTGIAALIEKTAAFNLKLDPDDDPFSRNAPISFCRKSSTVHLRTGLHLCKAGSMMMDRLRPEKHERTGCKPLCRAKYYTI